MNNIMDNIWNLVEKFNNEDDTKLDEGKVVTDKDNETTQKKKLMEQEPEDDKEPPISDTHEPIEDIEDEAENEKEAPEIGKEYLGKTEDTHFYMISEQEDDGQIKDLQIVDQEGVKKYSAKENNIDPQNVADFLIAAIQDIDIAEIDRSIFMKYILPLLVEEEDEETEEELETPEDMEEEEPIESKNESINESRKLFEMRVDDGKNTFDVYLVDSDTDDTNISINGVDFPFEAEFASYWRDEEGNMSEDGLKELALDALSNMEPEEYDELVAKGEIEDAEETNAEEAEPESPAMEAKFEEGEESKTNEDKDMLKGGLGDNSDESDFDAEQLKRGIKVEMEHADNPKIAEEIAKDHLTEDPQYYTKLDKMEAGACDNSKEDVDEKCGDKHKKDKKTNVKESEVEDKNIMDKENKIDKPLDEADISKGVKELTKAAKDAINDGDYIKAAELSQKLATIQQVVPPEVEQAAEETEEDKDKKEDDKPADVKPNDTPPVEESNEDLDEAKAKTKKKDPKAKTRNRGDVVFAAGSKDVKDDKDHFPINNEKQARNALARANQYKESPEWYGGSLKSLVSKVASKVKAKYPDIEVSKKAKKPGKESIEVDHDKPSLEESQSLGFLKSLLEMNRN